MSSALRLIRGITLAGFLALLPLVVVLAVVSWLYGFVTGLLSPLTDFVVGQLGWPNVLVNLMIIGGMLALFFLLGLVVKNRLGRRTYFWLERKTLWRVPGYAMVRQTIVQFSSRESSPFQAVALVRPTGDNQTNMLGFVTDRHADGGFTVFVPTGPNPTSGNIYLLPAELVTETSTPVDEAIRVVISCGAGSKAIPEQALKKLPPA